MTDSTQFYPSHAYRTISGMFGQAQNVAELFDRRAPERAA